MDGDEVGAVRKGALDLDFVKRGDHRGEDVPATEEGFAVRREGGDAVSAVADAFVDDVGDEPDGFGGIELEAAGEAALGEDADLGYEELVELGRRKESVSRACWRGIGLGQRCEPHAGRDAWLRVATGAGRVRVCENVRRERGRSSWRSASCG